MDDGEINPEAHYRDPQISLPRRLVDLMEGLPVPLENAGRASLIGRISQLNENTVTVDLNHPLAGQNFNLISN